MQLIVLHEPNYVTTLWKGGTTKQLLIMPPKAIYAKRNFNLRISIASVQIPSSEFTYLPGISRNIVLLEGALLLTLNKRKKQLLLPGDVLAFKGSQAISCKGTGSDFNVMVQENNLVQTDYLSLEKNETAFVSFEGQNQLAFLYVSNGSIEISCLGSKHKLIAGMSCYVPQITKSNSMVIACKAAANIVLTEVWLDRKA